MIFKMKSKKTRPKEIDWYLWFAWYPVIYTPRNEESRIIWMQYVWRRGSLVVDAELGYRYSWEYWVPGRKEFGKRPKNWPTPRHILPELGTEDASLRIARTVDRLMGRTIEGDAVTYEEPERELVVDNSQIDNSNIRLRTQVRKIRINKIRD